MRSNTNIRKITAIFLSVFLCALTLVPFAAAENSLGIIGGADGPTAIFVSAPGDAAGSNDETAAAVILDDPESVTSETEGKKGASENGGNTAEDTEKTEKVIELNAFESLISYGLVGFVGESVRTPLTIAVLILIALVAYALGSLNCGIIISKVFYHDDIRKYGSGNAGTTNMLRTYGKMAAAGTILGDALKVVLAILIAWIVGGIVNGAGHIAGFMAIIGHVYPVYYGFKGGKGVVASAVAILMLSPPVFAVIFTVFILVVLIWRYISLGSIVAAALYPFVNVAFCGLDMSNVFAVAVAIFVIYLHRTNIRRLLDGNENKLSFKKKDKKAVPTDESKKK